MIGRTVPWVLAIALSSATLAAAAVTTLASTKDNTLIQQTNPASQLSNGQGDIFVGRTNQDGQGTATISIRRGLVAFDVAGGIPSGSTITSVKLTVRETTGLSGDQTTTLHRVLQDWGVGTSFQNGGLGAAAQDDDATWLYTFYDFANPGSSPMWSTPGGDYHPTASASTVILDDPPAGQTFFWSSASDPQMLADVQGWLDNPGGNFGWLVRGNESAGQTAKRLNSGESAVPPALEVTYIIPEPSARLLLASGVVGLMLAGIARGRAG